MILLSISDFFDQLWNALSSLSDPANMIKEGGLAIVSLIVYGTTGLFFCFFIPSGAVLFTAGVFVAAGNMKYSIITVCIVLTLAALSGNLTGYWFGKKTGPLLYKRKDSRFFKQAHLKAASGFIDKYGKMAIPGGFFFPVVRTFLPILAGMTRMDFQRFTILSLIGSVVWILFFVLTGFLVGNIPFLKDYISWFVIGIIIIVTTPTIIRLVREFKKMKQTK